MARVLIVDDDLELCQLLQQYLTIEGFDISLCHDGESAVQLANRESFNAIILDVMLPKKNGFEVLKALRETLEVPVLMLTARGEDIDKIVGLEIGADDYISKPCNPRELVARLKAVLRRAEKHPTPGSKKPVLQAGNLCVNIPKRSVVYNEQALEVTNAEFNIIEMLLRTPGQAFSKEELTEHALGRKYTAFDRSIDVHISNLRNKLGNNSDGTTKIKTVRGFGYLFDEK
jgi:two-component system response regulator CpxR